MQESQKALFENAPNLIASHEQAAITLGGLCIAAAVFSAGWVHRRSMSMWLATSAQVGGLSLGVVVLAVQARRGGWLTGTDHAVTAWLVAHRQPVLDDVALAVTNALGPVAVGVLATLAAVAVGVRSRSVLCGLTVLVTVAGSSVLCWLTKMLVARPRPPLALHETFETDYSFPAGHVTGTAALMGILIVAAGLLAGRAVAALVVVGGVVVVSAIGLSRLYLGVHWLTDVLAGVLLAAAVVAVGAAALKVLVDDPAATTVEPVLLRSSGNALP